MATTNFSLSAKKNPDGEQRIIIRLVVNRKNRPTFKTPLWIHPQYCRGDVSGRGQVEIVTPKRGGYNEETRKKVDDIRKQLDTIAIRYRTIAESIEGSDIPADRETIESIYNRTQLLSVEKINLGVLQSLMLGNTDTDAPVHEDGSYLEHFKDYISSCDLTLSKRRVDHIKVTYRIVARFQMYKREMESKAFSLNIHTIDAKVLNEITDYILHEKELSEEKPKIFERILQKYPPEVGRKHKEPKLKERGMNVVGQYLKTLRAFSKWLNKNGISMNQPFLRFTMPKGKYGDPYYLTLEERKKLENYDFSGNPALEVQRDIFVFHCCVGCRVGDLSTFKPSNIIFKENGYVLSYIPQKTIENNQTTVEVPLNETALALVEKYKGVDKKGRLFPFISSNSYNENIRKFMKAAKIDRVVTVLNSLTGEQEQKPIYELASSHMARRTFIGNLYKKVQDPNLISSMSGHVEGSRAFARYRDIDMETKKNVIALID